MHCITLPKSKTKICFRAPKGTDKNKAYKEARVLEDIEQVESLILVYCITHIDEAEVDPTITDTYEFFCELVIEDSMYASTVFATLYFPDTAKKKRAVEVAKALLTTGKENSSAVPKK